MVVFVVDDPEVLFVVSSSLECSGGGFMLSSSLEQDEEEDAGVVVTTTSDFLEITDIITTGGGVLLLIAVVSFPLVCERMLVVGTTFVSLLELLLLLQSRTSIIFEFLPFHAFGGGTPAALVVVVVVAVVFVLMGNGGVAESACLGVGATGAIGLEEAPSMLSLRPFQAIVCVFI